MLDNFEELAASFADCSIQTELTDGCIPFTGGSICADDLLPSPVAGICSLCQLITVSGDCSGFYQG